ncbi:MAG: hypothetical protein HDR02_14240 [Lachnospiraceae bacterium]|nr:hypothetical protein [Lachnospiraceae bacterium]
MYYDKQIRYIDYLENGEKKRNCGYVKVTVTDSRLLLEMRIRDLYETDDVTSEVVVEGGGAEHRVGTVLIRQGIGSFLWECKDREREGEELELGENLSYGQLERIYVQLSPRRSLRCVWRTVENPKPNMTEPEQEDAVRAEEPDMAEPEQENAAQEREPDVEEPVEEDAVRTEEPDMAEPEQEHAVGAEEPDMTEPEQGDTVRAKESDMAEPEQESAVQEREPDVEEPVEVISAPAVHIAEEAGAAQPQQIPPEESIPPEQEIPLERPQALKTPHMTFMSEDKWQQLQKIHPHIRPFQDEREYLSLRPEDFVILHSSAYRLVQNSFLLHGYFNYDHLILTRVSQKGENQYYIGVPGNFFEKEKQVAIMYGFESFECRQEPAREGEFGYYMIRVEL